MLFAFSRRFLKIKLLASKPSEHQQSFQENLSIKFTQKQLVTIVDISQLEDVTIYYSQVMEAT